jgi:hypothetical protein
VADDVSAGVRALLDHLKDLGRRDALDRVLPPLTTTDVATGLAAAGVPVTQALVEWYSAWGGQTADGVLGTMDVIPGFYALALPDALAHRASRRWPAEWFPLLADGGGDFFVLASSSPLAPVLRVRHEEAEPERTSATLADFLDAIDRAFSEGVIYTSDGYLDQDDRAWRELLGVDT